MAKVAFIGAGRMAAAIIRGLLKAGQYQPGQVSIIGGGGSSAPNLAAECGLQLAGSPRELTRGADAVILACKPAQLKQLDAAYGRAIEGQLLISVLAGTPHARLREAFGSARQIVWAMPNTPAQLGQGATGWSIEGALSLPDQEIVETVLGTLGPTFQVAPEQMHGVTATSGSGPAWLFAYARACMEAAEAQGLPSPTARALVLQTIRGALALLESSGKAPQALIDEVASRGGTTEAGLSILESGAFSRAIAEAHAAAAARSREIADDSPSS